jgi:hypothetical protein
MFVLGIHAACMAHHRRVAFWVVVSNSARPIQAFLDQLQQAATVFVWEWVVPGLETP